MSQKDNGRCQWDYERDFWQPTLWLAFISSRFILSYYGSLRDLRSVKLSKSSGNFGLGRDPMESMALNNNYWGDFRKILKEGENKKLICQSG